VLYLKSEQGLPFAVVSERLVLESIVYFMGAVRRKIEKPASVPLSN
jgi:hypothetical protein